MTCPPDALPSGIPAQALIATSKKKFRHAVDRNRIKRLTRECYRTHKPQIYQFLNSHNVTIVLSLNYVHNEIFDHSTLNHKFDRITDTLIQHISTHLDYHPSQQS
jgi:ribonuclease P protein component